jgi:chemotaxis protein CheD
MPELRIENGKRTKKVVHINIGEYYACNNGEVLKTLLGSCVSACLYDEVANVSGMNHILLASKADMEMFDENARYGIHAMEMLIRDMLVLGAKRSRLKAKAFGGGNVLKTVSYENSPGAKNITFIKDFLALENIPLIAHDFGGPWTRVVHFHSNSNDVFIKKTESGSIKRKFAQTKHQATKTLEDKVVDLGGDIELFG